MVAAPITSLETNDSERGDDATVSLFPIEERSSLVADEPASADQEDVARKRAANPKLKVPPPPQWVLDGDNRIVGVAQEGVTRYRTARNYLAALIYNSFVTHIPFHAIRQGYLRLFGATIGKGTAVNRGTTVWEIEYLTIGDRTSIGFRCLLDCRGGVAIGDDVEIGQLDGDRAIEAAEKVLPVLAVGRGADILPRRDHIENDQRLVRCIHLHDRVGVFRPERGDKTLLEGSDVGPVVGPGRAAQCHDPEGK